MLVPEHFERSEKYRPPQHHKASCLETLCMVVPLVEKTSQQPLPLQLLVQLVKQYVEPLVVGHMDQSTKGFLNINEINITVILSSIEISSIDYTHSDILLELFKTTKNPNQ